MSDKADDAVPYAATLSRYEALVNGSWWPCEVLEAPTPVRREVWVRIVGLVERGTVVIPKGHKGITIRRKPWQIRPVKI